MSPDETHPTIHATVLWTAPMLTLMNVKSRPDSEHMHIPIAPGDGLGCLCRFSGLQDILEQIYLGQKACQLGLLRGNRAHHLNQPALGIPLLGLIQERIEGLGSLLTDHPHWIAFGLGLVRVTYCSRFLY
jgi:hypothetical protein